MQMPALDDTIVAVASAWAPAALGIVRLSGPAAFALAHAVGGPAPPPARPRRCPVHLKLGNAVSVPADAMCFPAPRSYTGQDLVELHTSGSPPLLRRLAAELIARGARRALPGEFTARAFVAGKLDAAQVDGVLALLHAHDAAAARQAARLALGGHRRRLREMLDSVEDLLAAVEAGIDFADEEDVSFISAPALRAAVDRISIQVRSEACERIDTGRRAGLPHVALAGLPNAGKSSLFNALIGGDRAIVSPVVGTTRDVLAAETAFGPRTVVLQDCAGLGHTPAEIELAAHLAAERTADQADLVLWVHAGDRSWTPAEAEACARIDAGRLMLVVSKCDLPLAAATPSPVPVLATVCQVSVATGSGLGALRAAIAHRLQSAVGGLDEFTGQMDACLSALTQVNTLAAGDGNLPHPELVALELRAVAEALGRTMDRPAVEDLLGRIFAQFCIGK